MSQPIAFDRSLELQWDWPRILRNPLGNDAAFAAFAAQSQTASDAGLFILDGRSVTGTNAYVRVLTVNFTETEGYGIGYYTGAVTFTAVTPVKLGNTTASPAFTFASKLSTSFPGTNYEQGGVLAETIVDITHGNWIMVPAGTGLLIQGDTSVSAMTVCIQWCEFTD